MSFPIKEKEKILKSIGLKIKKYRNEKSLSQEELADASGLHRTYIGAVERGERNITIINLYRISVALERSLFELLPSK